MLGQFPMIDDMVREQQRELNHNLRKVEDDFIADNTPDKRMSLAQLLKLIRR